MTAGLHLVQLLADGALDILIEMNLTLGDLAQRRDRGLVAARDERATTVGQSTRAHRGDNDQRQAAGFLFETIFDGDASQGDLQKDELWWPREATKAGQSSYVRRGVKAPHTPTKIRRFTVEKAQACGCKRPGGLLDSIS